MQRSLEYKTYFNFIKGEDKMKKILAIVMLAFTMSVNAFWNGNNMPWNNGFNNNNGYNNYNQGRGYQQDNGFFAYNPYDYWDPRWYAEEMGNMFDEFDNNNSWGGNNYNNRGYGYNPYNNNNIQTLPKLNQVK